MGEHPGYVAPAGWYVDPGDDGQLRWWSGLDWTDHCAPMVEHRPEPDPRPSVDADPDRPLTRRERRQLDEQADATRALPPPVPRIAPITSYGWDRESDPTEDRFGYRLPVQPSDREMPADRYLDIPSRWSSASVWLIAFMPWISVLSAFAALMLAAVSPAAWWWQLGAVLLPFLLTLAAAQRDVLRLRIWRHRIVAHWAWSLLGAPAYLIARTVVLRRNAGLGSAPLWVWLVNLLLASGAVVLVLTLVGLRYRVS
ncbi:DUF2510 domain-containing protein [Cryobacterium sp. PAMC25264]|uniref:DUF2510 domain-containing protein n=1 Tax=Cryobacterium sp. PAMC25264 TaxID=2861288 RepID=UPI001C639CDB|nr:DUF2510 domain-containing protein [Cryobacterium sp. PAMC25264]QYF72391.1 DUF2510 domain-containing protein [Cryobacterium sp. PAMC25264]